MPKWEYLQIKPFYTSRLIGYNAALRLWPPKRIDHQWLSQSFPGHRVYWMSKPARKLSSSLVSKTFIWHRIQEASRWNKAELKAAL
jgi:hypothetical protein